MTFINKLRFGVAVLAISLLLLSFQLSGPKNWLLSDYSWHEVAELLDNVSPYEYNALFLLSNDTVKVLKEREFLVAFGVPSLDIPKRRWRRDIQRSTCWQFPGVATRHNNYTGAMLVLYLLGRHPLNNFTLSDAVLQEAKQWDDILVSPMNEGLSDTDKMKVGKGYWGFEAEIGASRKTFFWFQMALLLFPRVPYLAKGDDDTFLRVPQYLADLRRLPIKRIYWGHPAPWQAWKNKNGDLTKPFNFMVGFCYTMTRDIAEHVTSYEPLKKMVWVPFRKEWLALFRLLSMENEDIMIARTLYETKYPAIHVREALDRFQSVPNSSVTDAVVAVHGPEEQDYYIYMSHFKIKGTTTPETVIVKVSKMIFRMQPPKQKKILVKKN